ncbi:hypothetical protein CEK60_21880 [Halomonas sp. N3-2A]|nr:hypothetical protein CEK60_21880 [Halomonas sp. N3-2A]
MASSSPLSLSLTGLPLRSSALASTVISPSTRRLVDGEITVDASAEDRNGNPVSDSDSGELDATAGTLDVTLGDLSDDTAVEISGTNHVAFAVGDHQGDGLAVGDVAGGTADLHGGVVAEVTQGDVERTGGGVEFARNERNRGTRNGGAAAQRPPVSTALIPPRVR